MIKAFLRFSLLLILCTLLVYAPEILTSVSPPYSLSMPERTLLRIALCCDSETFSRISQIILSYQKKHPSTHMRITQISSEQLSRLASPHPDAILCPEAFAAQLPEGFTPIAIHQDSLLFALSESEPAAAAQLAAYIIEAAAPQNDASEI